MILLFVFLFLALGVSFFCSILESVLLSVTPSYAAALEEKSPRLGAELKKLKKDIDRPLAAILSLNTVAHTIGAAGVGAQAMRIFGEAYVAVISAVLTLLILIVSEIIPKTLGAIYWRKLVSPSIHTIKVLIFLLYPFVILSRKITLIISKDRKNISVSRDEIRTIVNMGFQEGSLLKKESTIINNLMRFGKLMAKDIMTPHSVMLSLSADMRLEDVIKQNPVLRFSRIPIYRDNFEHIDRYVLKDDILLGISKTKKNKKLDDISRELLVVPEMVTLYKLFDQLINRRETISLIVDEHGGVAGIVTIEDIVETLIGIEIMDETDITEDMQKFARMQWIKRAKRLGLISEEDEIEEWFNKLDNN